MHIHVIVLIYLFQVGHMIQAEVDPKKRDEYLQRLMDLPNQVCPISNCLLLEDCDLCSTTLSYTHTPLDMYKHTVLL